MSEPIARFEVPLSWVAKGMLLLARPQLKCCDFVFNLIFIYGEKKCECQICKKKFMPTLMIEAKGRIKQ